MKTEIETFKKYGAHYYENDEQAIIEAMEDYARAKYMEGYKDGSNDATHDAQEEINENYKPNHE